MLLAYAVVFPSYVEMVPSSAIAFTVFCAWAFSAKACVETAGAASMIAIATALTADTALRMNCFILLLFIMSSSNYDILSGRYMIPVL